MKCTDRGMNGIASRTYCRDYVAAPAFSGAAGVSYQSEAAIRSERSRPWYRGSWNRLSYYPPAKTRHKQQGVGSAAYPRPA